MKITAKTTVPKAKTKSGKYVQTMSGKTGKTINNDPNSVNGKLAVYLDDGTKLLCDPDNLITTGTYR